jgi:predicted HTH domain antitoxin
MTSDPVAARPDDEDLATAVGLYALGEISLGKAAEWVEMDRWEFEELLTDAGFLVLYGTRNREETLDEVDTALDLE